MFRKIFVVIVFIYLPAGATAADDYTIDPETSTAIPTFKAKVLLARGHVTRLRSGSSYEVNLKKGSKIQEGDTITTGRRSYVKLKMVDDSFVTLGPEGQVVISKYQYKSKEKRTVVYELVKGMFRANVAKKVPKGHKVEVNSRYSSMGIRGTEVLANVKVNKMAKTITQFALLSGKAKVLNKLNQKSIDLAPGKIVLIAGGANHVDYEQVVVMSDAEFKRLNDPAFKEGNVFPALMKYMNPYPVTNSKSKGEKRGRTGVSRQEGGFEYDGWRKKLNELNQLLEDN